MSKRTISIDVDFAKKDILKKFSIKQFDNATIEINTYMNGVIYNPIGNTCKLFVAIANEAYMQEANIQVQENKVIINLDKNMISKSGTAYAELELKDSNGVMTSATFLFYIENKVGEGANIPGNVEGFVAKYERLIKEFKAQVDSTVKDCNTRVDNKLIQLQTDYNTTKNEVVKKTDDKIEDIEKRFNKLTSQQQQDAEVIDARDGEISLPARLDRDLKYDDGTYVKDKISFIEGLQESQNLKYSTEKGFILCENTRNGVIDNLKLSGRTWVNIVKLDDWFTKPTKLSTDSMVSVSLSNCPADKFKIFHVKENTDYTLIPLIEYENSTFANNGCYLQLNVLSDSASKMDAWFRVYQHQFNKPYLFNSKDLTRIDKWSLFLGGYNGEITIKSVKMVILEGDHTQNPPSFFEGIKSVGDGVDSLEVMSCNKANIVLEDGSIFGDGTNGSYANRVRCRDYINSVDGFTDIYNIDFNIYSIIFYEYDINKTFIKQGSYTNKNIKLSSNCVYYRFVLKKNNEGSLSVTTHKFNIFRIGHKKQILCYDPVSQTWKKPIVREWDYIEQHSNGKWYYHKRSEEKLFNGSSDEVWSVNDWQPTSTDLINIYINVQNAKGKLAEVKCDKFSFLPMNTQAEVDLANRVEGVRFATFSNNLLLNISKSKLETQDVAGFKKWLQANPVTVVYQLAQEEVYECTPLNLDSYEGETLLQFLGGAINPKLEFEVTSHINNVIMSNKNRINYLENKLIEGLKQVLAGDMQSLAYMLYPDDFENINENIPMTIPELY